MVAVGSVHKALEMQARLTPKRAKSRAKPMHHSVPAWSPPARNLNISSAHFERASRGSHVSPARSMQCLPSGLGLRTLRPLRPLRPCMLARPAVPSLCSLCSLFSTPACSQSHTIPTPHAGGSPVAVPVSRNTSPATRRPCVDLSFDGLNKIYILNILPFHTKNTTARARLAEA